MCVCVCVCVCVAEREIYGLDKEREIAGVYKVSSSGTIKTSPFFRVLLFIAQTVHALFTMPSVYSISAVLVGSYKCAVFLEIVHSGEFTGFLSEKNV